MAEILSDLGRTEKTVQIRMANVRAIAVRETLKTTVKLRKESKIRALTDRLTPLRTPKKKVVAAAPNEKTGEKTDAEAIESEMEKSHELTANQIEHIRT